MIRFEHLWKWHPTPAGRHYVLRDVDIELPRGVSIGIVGGNGAGKSTLLRLIGGNDFPDRGRVVRDCRISWPLGLSGGFQGSLTGRQNALFIARIHGDWKVTRRILAFTEDFSELGDYFDMPVKTYSSGMRSRLGFALSIAFAFDVYLIDEATSVGDENFRQKSEAALQDLRSRASVIMVSHSMDEVARMCDAGLHLHAGVARYHPRVQDAIDAHLAISREPHAA